MKRLVDLQCSFNALHHAKEDGQEQDNNSDPKGIPLDTIPSIPPPLRYCCRSRLVESLLQDNQAVVPEVEFLNLSMVESHRVTFQKCHVDPI